MKKDLEKTSEKLPRDTRHGSRNCHLELICSAVSRGGASFFSTISRTPSWTRLLGDFALPLVDLWLLLGGHWGPFRTFWFHLDPVWLPFGTLWPQNANKMSTIGLRRPNQSKNGAPKNQNYLKTRCTGSKMIENTPTETKSIKKGYNEHTSMQTNTSQATAPKRKLRA